MTFITYVAYFSALARAPLYFLFWRCAPRSPPLAHSSRGKTRVYMLLAWDTHATFLWKKPGMAGQWGSWGSNPGPIPSQKTGHTLWCAFYHYTTLPPAKHIVSVGIPAPVRAELLCVEELKTTTEEEADCEDDGKTECWPYMEPVMVPLS